MQDMTDMLNYKFWPVLGQGIRYITVIIRFQLSTVLVGL